MIRKLRWKFVAVCMGLVALVLSAVFGAAYHAVRQNIEDLSRQMLYQVLREDSGRGAVPNPTIEIGGDRVLLPYFTVNIWGDTAYITGGTYADLENTDTLRDILSQCLEQGAAEGTVSEYHLRYLSMDNGLYRKLAFVDMSMEQAVLRRLVRSYLLIALGAMLVLLGIAAAASRWVTRPVEKAWKQQRQFLSDASHELKTPLMAIQGYAEGIQAGVMDTGSAAEVILAESDRMTELVEELLDISKIDMGRQPLTLSEMDVRELLYDSIRAVEPAAAGGGITITPDFPETPVMVSCDDTRLRRAVTNILSNGVRYARSELRLTCRADKRHVTIRIQDDGDGIAEEDLPHIFDRFYMGRSGKSGIGLALTKEIVHLHKGTIRAYNGDTGAVFEISIPVSR